MTDIAKRLKFIRKVKGLTQEELGQMVSVSKQAIANIESSHNKPSIEFISKLIENLNVNANWFIAGVGDMFITSAKQFEQERDVFAQRVRELIGEEFKARGL